MNNVSWYRGQWYDFRQGHGLYLVFAMSFVNFILIFYRLLIEKIDFLEELFAELWIFVIIFLAVYIPIAIVVGKWHRKTQMKIDHKQSMEQNPVIAKNFRIILDLLEGKASEKEVEEYRKFLKLIEDR